MRSWGFIFRQEREREVKDGIGIERRLWVVGLRGKVG